MLIAAIDEYLQGRPRDDRATRCFHPSSLHKSEKELYRHYLQGDGNRKFDSRVLRIFDNGHAVHTRLQGYLGQVGLLTQAEVPVKNTEYEILGHTDGIIEADGVRGILEIKSINSMQFHGLHEPKLEHLIQSNIYMFCSNIPRACILYECKDNQALKEFYVQQDHQVLDPILTKIRHVQQCLRSGREP
nr:hypothetical protein 15 [Desulfobacterales bacterium]